MPVWRWKLCLPAEAVTPDGCGVVKTSIGRTAGFSILTHPRPDEHRATRKRPVWPWRQAPLHFYQWDPPLLPLTWVATGRCLPGYACVLALVCIGNEC